MGLIFNKEFEKHHEIDLQKSKQHAMVKRCGIVIIYYYQPSTFHHRVWLCWPFNIVI
jgi:hypothetical protein